MQQQYTQAELFLGELANRLLEGDRKKIVITPGNHDVNFPRVFSSLQEVDYTTVDENQRSDYARLIWERHSTFRWSWSDFKLYKIIDEKKYVERFAEFIAFYNRFYDGITTYSSDPNQQFDIFDFPDLELVITGFNSCF